MLHFLNAHNINSLSNLLHGQAQAGGYCVIGPKIINDSIFYIIANY